MRSRPGDEAKRALDAAARELPSPEMTRRMAEGLGLASSTVAAAATYAAAEAKAAGLGAAGASALVRPALLSVSVVALTVAGAVVGNRWSSAHRTSSHASHAIAAVVAPAPLVVPMPPPPKPALPAIDERSQTSAARPTRVAPSRMHVKTPVTNNDLRAEIALVDAIRTTILAGNDSRALSLLQTYDDRYRSGIFRLEAATLRIEVLARLGQSKRARALAVRFLASNPDSVLALRVERATGLAPR